MFGMAPVDLRPRMDEALDCIVALLRGETVTKKTAWFDSTKRACRSAVFQADDGACGRRDPLTGGCACGRTAWRESACPSGVDDASLKHHVANWKIYEETCARHGHVADRSRWQFALQIHLAESREQARKDVEYGWKNGSAMPTTSCPHPMRRRADSPIPRAGWWRTSAQSLARPTMRLRKSSTCSRSPAASAACWCLRTIGRTGRRPSAASN